MLRLRAVPALIVTTLIATTVLVVISTLTNTYARAKTLPPPLGTYESKASLFSPRMKRRGPVPGGGLVAKPMRNSLEAPR